MRELNKVLKRLVSEIHHADPERIFRLFVAEAGEDWDEAGAD